MKNAQTDPHGSVKQVLETLIMWMAQSANSPISAVEAKILLDRLNEVKE